MSSIKNDGDIVVNIVKNIEVFDVKLPSIKPRRVTLVLGADLAGIDLSAALERLEIEHRITVDVVRNNEDDSPELDKRFLRLSLEQQRTPMLTEMIRQLGQAMPTFGGVESTTYKTGEHNDWRGQGGKRRAPRRK